MKIKKLWEVQAKDRGGFGLLEGDLLILARSVAHAIQKAEKWLKRHSYYAHRVTKVNFVGEIDAF